jgi:hypothetical protein
MGKRSNFERKPRDFYPTPLEAVEPLIPHLDGRFTFTEPCAGNGVLVDHLESNGGHCTWASDIEPQKDGIISMDYSELSDKHTFSNYIITNPPWDRTILHPMIEHFSDLIPTWLLFDADWMHTKQSRPYLSYLHKVVSVGRIKWFGNMTGKDNCAWYLFDAQTPPIMGTFFYGRI